MNHGRTLSLPELFDPSAKLGGRPDGPETRSNPLIGRRVWDGEVADEFKPMRDIAAQYGRSIKRAGGNHAQSTLCLSAYLQSARQLALQSPR